jgi:hypothetical protein
MFTKEFFRLDEYTKRLRKLPNKLEDPVEMYIEANEILCKALKDFGFGELVTVYDEVGEKVGWFK